jgi:putative transposase
VTPSQRHRGEDKKMLEQRNDLYKAARKNNPSQWLGNTRNWSWIDSVNLNPKKLRT